MKINRQALGAGIACIIAFPFVPLLLGRLTFLLIIGMNALLGIDPNATVAQIIAFVPAFIVTLFAAAGLAVLGIRFFDQVRVK